MQKDQDLSDSFSTATSETTDTVEDTRALSRVPLAGDTALLNPPVTRSCMAANEGIKFASIFRRISTNHCSARSARS
jgi:hypothetical protein